MVVSTVPGTGKCCAAAVAVRAAAGVESVAGHCADRLWSSEILGVPDGRHLATPERAVVVGLNPFRLFWVVLSGCQLIINRCSFQVTLPSQEDELRITRVVSHNSIGGTFDIYHGSVKPMAKSLNVAPQRVVSPTSDYVNSSRRGHH